MNAENVMRKISIAKLTLNVGAGKDQNLLNKGIKLIKHITGAEPVKTLTNKRLQAWGLRPGLPIGCKLTIRDQERIKTLIKRCLESKEFLLSKKQFDNNGNIAFGIPEYIDVGDTEYNPEIGIMGFEVCITLNRPGFRIRDRRIMKRKIPHKHRISQDEAIQFMKDNFKIKIVEEEETGEE
jgi:large subunit ribosomal protein L5